jgi:hypothetical protein
MAAADDLVDKSIVTVPKSVGQFTLENATYDPAKPKQGVEAVYTFPGASKEVRIRVSAAFVGRPPVEKPDPDEADYLRNKRYDEAVNLLANADLGQLKSRTTDLKVGRAQEVFLERTPSFLVKPPARPNGTSRGVAHVTQFTMDGKAYTGLTTVFYRDLFNISVRVFIPGTEQAQVAAVPFADAVRKIVPLVDVRNFGPCGDIEPGPGQSGGVYAMQDNINRVRTESCAKNEAGQMIPLPAGQRWTIVYPKAGR